MKYSRRAVLLLFPIWLVWSGHYAVLTVSLGAVSCLLVLLIARRMRILDQESVPVELGLRALAYAPWLVWQIARSSTDVALRILTPSLPISPRLIRVQASQRADFARVIYANSITLTPGTVTVDIEGAEIWVHALTTDAAGGVQGGEMDRRVSRIEGHRR